MSRTAFWKVVVVSILTAFLSAPALRATEPRRGLEPVEAASIAGGFLEQAWSFLARFWAANGCVLDPSGLYQPAAGTSSITSDHGCVIDPSGHCIG